MRDRRIPRRAARAAAVALLALVPAIPSRAEEPSPRFEALERQVRELAEQNAMLRARVEELEQSVEEARDSARAAEDSARADSLARRPTVGGGASPPSAAASRPDPASAPNGLFARPLGRANLRLLDVSLDVLAAAGLSSAEDHELETLQAGDHDPRQRGFTLQAAELSLLGAVDPFLRGEVHLQYFLDPEGESRFEIEEAFLTTQTLPFGLEEHGLEIEAGHFFTEFGRLNPRHPHSWHWQDQPLVLSRLFGGDGLRAPGVRLGWLTPLPWFSELHLGAQNARGETVVSFLANDEFFEERPIGGRPFAPGGVHGPGDLLKLVRWVNGFDLSDSLSSQIGLSFLHGPNATGPDGRTLVYGADFVVKWRPLQTDRGWPFLVFESELMRRSYRADAFFGCPEEPEADPCPVPLAALAGETLRDWGGYAQLLWGFRRSWGVGLRYEYASGSVAGSAYDPDSGGFVRVDRDEDPFRADRHRVSPLLVFHPSEFSRLRLQYNYDRADSLVSDDAHTLWAGVEFLFGSHPAHEY